MFIRTATALALALICSTAHAVDQARSRELARAIYGSSEVKALVAPAKTLRHVPATEEDNPSMVSAPDCSQNPAPYGQPKKDFCAVEIDAAYGWYADPVLVVRVKAFIAKGLIERGSPAAKDLILRSVSVEIPDPTGLE